MTFQAQDTSRTAPDNHGMCLSDTHCKAYDRIAGHPYPTSAPLCPDCLAAAEPDVRGLLYDYLDLAQLHAPAMSQAPSEHTSGGEIEASMPLRGHVEALQAEILHVTATWEHALRAHQRLSNPGTWAPLWTRTVYDHLNLVTGRPGLKRARAGAQLQRALSIITPRPRNNREYGITVLVLAATLCLNF